jgi:hypothetical protein
MLCDLSKGLASNVQQLENDGNQREFRGTRWLRTQPGPSGQRRRTPGIPNCRLNFVLSWADAVPA